MKIKVGVNVEDKIGYGFELDSADINKLPSLMLDLAKAITGGIDELESKGLSSSEEDGLGN